MLLAVITLSLPFYPLFHFQKRSTLNDVGDHSCQYQHVIVPILFLYHPFTAHVWSLSSKTALVLTNPWPFDPNEYPLCPKLRQIRLHWSGKIRKQRTEIKGPKSIIINVSIGPALIEVGKDVVSRSYAHIPSKTMRRATADKARKALINTKHPYFTA